MNICWFATIFLLGISIFKGLTARRFYKSFGDKTGHLEKKISLSLRHSPVYAKMLAKIQAVSAHL
jgi:hypothetical protein